MLVTSLSVMADGVDQFRPCQRHKVILAQLLSFIEMLLTLRSHRSGKLVAATVNCGSGRGGVSLGSFPVLSKEGMTLLAIFSINSRALGIRSPRAAE